MDLHQGWGSPGTLRSRRRPRSPPMVPRSVDLLDAPVGSVELATFLGLATRENDFREANKKNKRYAIKVARGSSRFFGTDCAT